MRNSETDPSKTNWVKKYRSKEVSMYRFKLWSRPQQLTYIDMRKKQLEDIKSRFAQGELSPREKHSNAILYKGLNRELTAKCWVFNALDRMFNEERVWLQIGYKHRHQTTLDKWVVIHYRKNI